MAQSFLAAVVQVNGNNDVDRNERIAVQLIREAAQEGAEFVAIPEDFFFIGPAGLRPQHAQSMTGPRLKTMSALARDLELHLLVGSVAEATSDPSRCFNTSVLLGPKGQILSQYRKLHLFDVNIPEGVQFEESSTVIPGDGGPCVVQTALATFGLSICYDLRFPELYRALSAQGAQVLTVPAAFTLHTGKDHWQVLLRARAIENTAWVIAPNHCGQHSRSRASYGHSMIVDPWGTVVAECLDDISYATARVDLSVLETVRQQLPCLKHRRL